MKRTMFKDLNKHKVLIALVALLSIVCVFMNLFTSLRWSFAPGLTFGNIFFTWIPMILCDILIECYGKKKGIVIPAFIYLIQGLFFLLAVILVSLHPSFLIWKTDSNSGAEIFPIMFSDTLRVWLGSVTANYAGFLVNSITMYILKKKMKDSDKWYKLMIRAIGSTMLGQFVDNALFMSIGLNMWDWTSIGWRQLAETGMEVIFFPITFLIIRKINKLPDIEVDFVNSQEKIKSLEVNYNNVYDKYKHCLSNENYYNNKMKEYETINGEIKDKAMLQVSKLENKNKEQSNEVRRLKALLKKNNIEVKEKVKKE